MLARRPAALCCLLSLLNPLLATYRHPSIFATRESLLPRHWITVQHVQCLGVVLQWYSAFNFLSPVTRNGAVPRPSSRKLRE